MKRGYWCSNNWIACTDKNVNGEMGIFKLSGGIQKISQGNHIIENVHLKGKSSIVGGHYWIAR